MTSRHLHQRALTLGGLLLLALPLAAADGPGPLMVTVRKRQPVVMEKVVAQADGTVKKVTETTLVPTEVARELDLSKTAIVVCDMWDDHWCQSAAKRCGELAKQAEPVLAAARARGATIIHAPSDCMKFYADHPARRRAQAAPAVASPKGKEVVCPPLPVDDSDGGCDDVPQPPSRRAWSRQHAAITVDAEKDYVTDNGQEVYNILRKQGATTLVVMGVHTNMCVLNRSFAIKQMVKWGVDVLLIRDQTDAMYNPKMRPFVSHEKGTQLIIEFIEGYWCPTLEARRLVGR